MTLVNDPYKSQPTREQSICAQRVIVQWLVTCTIAPTGHTASSSWSSAQKKFSKQNPEWFDSIGMAKKTPKFWDLPFVQLTTTCTTDNILEVAVETRLLPLALLCWTVPVVAHWRCELAKPAFFALRVGVRTNRTSSQSPRHQKTGYYFLYRHPALSQPEVRTTTPMPSHSHGLEAVIPWLWYDLTGTFSRQVEKTSGTHAGYQ